jgi:Skp family chaperone for outer membrane proteins
MGALARALGLACALIFAAVPALAQSLPPAVVAVVDYQRLLRDAKAAKSIRAQIEERRARYQDEIRAEEQRLIEVERELTRQRGVLSTEAYAQRRSAFEQDAARVQRMVQERRRELDAVSAAAYAELRNAIIEVVGRLAESRGFNLVLPSSAVLLFSPQLDLTEEALAALDRRLPDVRVPEQPPAR